MIFRNGLKCLPWLLLALAVLPASAQTVFPLLVQVRVGDNVQTVPNGANIAVAAEAVGRPLSILLNARNRGNTQVTIATGPDLLGASDFSLLSAPTAATVLNPGETTSIEIAYRPRTSRLVSAQLSFVISEPAADGRPVFNVFSLNITGTAPEIVLAYTLPSNGNVLSLANGGAVLFPDTTVGTNSVATLILFNRGSAPGTVQSLSLTGADFELLGAPLLPGSIDSQREVRFGVRYTPKQNGPSRGSLTLVLDSETITVSLEAAATGPQLVFDAVLEEQTLTADDGGVINLPETNVGRTRTFQLRVRNTGTADTTVTSISLTGAGYQLSDLPPLPQSLARDGSLVFTVSLTPAAPGAARGRLRVNNATIEFLAQAAGPRLAYSYALGEITVELQPSGAVLFSATPIGQSRQASFTVSNTGTSAASIASIALTDLSAGFELTDLPALPLRLEPNASISFGLRYSPDTAALTTTNLRVDTVSFSVSGNGAPAVPLPGYRFEGASATVEPLSQPAVSLQLESTYPVALSGSIVLTLEPLSGLSPDGSVVFATGGRTVTFTIPAGSTQARFANGETSLRLQSGTVAGDIVLTPSFATRGGFNLTPSSPTIARLRVPLAAPRLLTVNAAEAAGSILFTVTGYATGRSLRNAIVELAARPGFQLAATRLTVPVSDPAVAWFRSPSSQTVGGQFVLALPLSFRTDVPGVNALDGIQSITISVDSESGASNTVTVQR
ncbi:MAG: choice-of-anchor D domain-containing protein [Bryobacteraceae bacterium]|nr:choice-of-anchor D domain-containing protein [Bryobacteraceae bacterium]